MFPPGLYVTPATAATSEQPFFSQITATYRAVPPVVIKIAHGGGLLNVSQANDGRKHELRSGMGFVTARRIM